MYFVIGLLVGSLTSWLLDWLFGRIREPNLAKRLAQLEQQEREWQNIRAGLQRQVADNSREIEALKQEIANKKREILVLNELVDEYSIRLDRAETTNQDWMGRWDTAQAELEELRLALAKNDGTVQEYK